MVAIASNYAVSHSITLCTVTKFIGIVLQVISVNMNFLILLFMASYFHCCLGIPACAVDRMWTPLSEMSDGAGDASLANQHVCLHNAGELVICTDCYND